MISYVIGILLDMYNEDEKTKVHKEIRRRITIEMGKLTRKYGKEAMYETIENHGLGIWKDTLNKFSDEKITMDARACILFLYGLDDKNLSKLFTLGKGIMEKWGKHTGKAELYELDNNSRIIARYIVDRANLLYGIKEEKSTSLSLLSKKIAEAKKKQNIISMSA